MSRELRLFDERSREYFERHCRGVRSGALAPALLLVMSDESGADLLLPEIVRVATAVIRQHRSRADLHLLVVKGRLCGVVVELLSRRTISCLVDYARHFESDLGEAFKSFDGKVHVYNPLIRAGRSPRLPEALRSVSLAVAAEFIPALRGRRRRGIRRRVIRHEGTQFELVALRPLPKSPPG
jgi:hypothetical protein